MDLLAGHRMPPWACVLAQSDSGPVDHFLIRSDFGPKYHLQRPPSGRHGPNSSQFCPTAQKPGHPSTFKGSECIIHCSLLWIWETCLGARYQADFKLTWPPRHETLRGSKGLGIVTRARAQCHAFEAAKLPLLYEKRFFYLGPAAVREIR